MNALALLESMAGVSATMVEAARANDWDRLTGLERESAKLRDALIRLESGGQPQAELTEAQRQRKALLLSRLLDDDREIRTHVKPWLDSTRKLLSGSVRERALRTAYGA